MLISPRPSAWCAALLCLAANSFGTELASAAKPAPPLGGGPVQHHYVVVPLPITGSIDLNIRKVLDQIIDDLPAAAETRPLLVLEFRPQEGQAGEGTEFERALALARYLAGERVRGVRTVAYLPSAVRGHAVLPVLACEEIIMAAEATLGQAGLDETHIDPTVSRGYTEIADRRRTIPATVALAMLEKDLTVYRAQTGDGIRYVTQPELDALKEQVAVSSVETLVGPGELAEFTGREMRLKYGFASHLAENRQELATALQVSLRSLQEDPSYGEGWVPIRVEIDGPIHEKNVNWIERSLRQQLQAGPINFLCVTLDTPGGSLVQSVRLANFLVGQPADEIRSVAYVQREARGDAALIAWACDQLVMAEDAILGGPGAEALSFGELEELKPTLQALARQEQRSWSVPLALLDPTVQLFRYERTDRPDVGYFTPEEAAELPDAADWVQREEVDLRQGISGRQAVEMQLARGLAADFNEFARLYHLEDRLPSVRPNWAHVLIEYLASPQIAGTLLFIGCFALMVELTTPGLGVAGLMSGVCFLLFFWANFLHGTAGWLEVLLFLAGLACIAMEVFVLPGVGVFGAGGALMVILSLVLASQTFIIPRNAYQMRQLPTSLYMVVAAGGGVLISMALLRRYLRDAPVFSRMLLEPPEDERLEELERREALVDWGHLVGKCGVTVTQLMPGGKARVGDELVDVISDGELIEPGVKVCVAQVRGNRVMVQRQDGAG